MTLLSLVKPICIDSTFVPVMRAAKFNRAICGGAMPIVSAIFVTSCRASATCRTSSNRPASDVPAPNAASGGINDVSPDHAPPR
jgi:hypothetical protein